MNLNPTLYWLRIVPEGFEFVLFVTKKCEDLPKVDFVCNLFVGTLLRSSKTDFVYRFENITYVH